MRYCTLGLMTLLVQHAMAFTSRLTVATFRPSYGLSLASRLMTSTTTASSGLSGTDKTDTAVMKDILYRVRDVNHMPNSIRDGLVDFSVDSVPLGLVTQQQARKLCEVGPEVFELAESNGKSILTLSQAAGNTPDSRTAAVASVMDRLREQGVVKGWRNELYPVASSFYDSPVFVMERAAVPQLGAIEYGVHINGLVFRESRDETRMWMARRSPTKSKYPNYLDHIVAGGQPTGISLMDNVIKECHEEANIPTELTRQGLRSGGAVSYATYSPKDDTVSRAVLFTFDLMLPADFQPTPVDGEVQEFFQWSVPDLLRSMAPDYPDPIKPNCYSCIIDWLVRDGHLSPDTPGYLDVVRELRSGVCR
jgi:8-oxo-dGTP pyrophosphatase MutT (NUDIX family)